MMFRTILVAAAALFSTAVLAQEVQSIDFDGHAYNYIQYEPTVVRVEEYLGRDALYVRRGTPWRENLDLSDVVIEYDYASTHASGFIGVNFRVASDGMNLEQFYTRPHQSGQPDATQYMVMINGIGTWQLHAGPNEATAIDLPAQEWISIRIVAMGDEADIFVGDMETPLIHVPNLRYDGRHGTVSFYAADRPWMQDTGAYFSNVNIRAADENDAIIGSPRETEPAPVGLITQFGVSSAIPESDVDGVFALGTIETTWTTLTVEDDGVANLARVATLSEDGNTAYVRLNITAEEDTERLMNFGYSDRVRLFVNGEQMYQGNAQWRSRDHRFLGTVALVDAIPLRLRAGENEVIAAVSESFGGWGFKAQIEDQTGLTIAP